jgi:hypothetical protein
MVTYQDTFGLSNIFTFSHKKQFKFLFFCSYFKVSKLV